MNVIFDEVELYYHPEMQRQFTNIMMKTLKSVQFTNMRGINIMIVTHSPFVLSDIPESNVLCLGEGDNEVTKTLGGNIMEMLSSSFFMNNSIGDAIKEEISAIVTLYNRAIEGQNVRTEYMNSKVRMRYICENLGDDFLKRMVTRMVDEIAFAVKSN
jgi:predicted ATP-binding protein involved in virulence